MRVHLLPWFDRRSQREIRGHVIGGKALHVPPHQPAEGAAEIWMLAPAPINDPTYADRS